MKYKLRNSKISLSAANRKAKKQKTINIYQYNINKTNKQKNSILKKKQTT